MNEAEWLESTDPEGMLRFLGDKGSARKLQLFAWACSRSVWYLLGDKRRRKAVDVPEPYAEDLISTDDLAVARADESVPLEAAWVWAEEAVKEARAAGEERRCCALLREVFGNPFRRVQIDLAWLTWNYGQLARMARSIYDERRFADMPLLGERLLHAGCKDADIQAHCRELTEHVRGCWLVDALLGKP